jgi:CIC family chloride channel protein
MRYRSPQPNLDGDLELSPRFWGLLAATGVVTGIAAGLLMRLLRAVQHVAWDYRAGSFFDAVARAPALRTLVVLTAAGLLIGALRRWLGHHGGGHGGEVSAAIWLNDGRANAVAALGSAVLSIVGVGMGVALGREGAPKQAGAAAASLFADWFHLSVAQRRLLAACGAGAGMAAVYDVPLGGALFAIEVLLGVLTLPLVLPALAAAGIATAVSWLLLPHVVTYDVTFAAMPSGALLLFAVLAGPACGLAAALHVRAIAWADRKKPRGAAQIIAPVAVLFVLGLLALRFPQLLGNGKDVVGQALADTLPLGLLGALLPLRLLATTGCLAAGLPGGLFTPTLAIGALLGGLLGHAVPGLVPGTPALIGAAAFLAAATQGPISSMVLVLELTRRIDPQAVPLLLAVAGAGLTARVLERRSIYAARLPH